MGSNLKPRFVVTDCDRLTSLKHSPSLNPCFYRLLSLTAQVILLQQAYQG